MKAFTPEEHIVYPNVVYILYAVLVDNDSTRLNDMDSVLIAFNAANILGDELNADNFGTFIFNIEAARLAYPRIDKVIKDEGKVQNKIKQFSHIAEDFVILDNEGRSSDRYTIFPYYTSSIESERVVCLGMSEGGLAVSMWDEVNAKDLVNLDFLGKRIKFSNLSRASQLHLMNRIAENN